HASHSAPHISQCGSSPEEARSLNCRFELHNFAWVPPECYDTELADEWDRAETWQFSRNDNGTDPITKQEALRGDLPEAWVPWGQHLAHCALIWKKYKRSVMFNRPMDNWTSSYMHTAHCATNLIRWDLDPSSFNSRLHLKFPVCDYRWREARQFGGVSTEGHGHGYGPEHEHEVARIST
ncbi:hypothetical protein DM02DRAFT_546082, partial [Periconia macrospinosa]